MRLLFTTTILCLIGFSFVTAKQLHAYTTFSTAFGYSAAVYPVNDALEYLRPGMTRQEVLSLLHTLPEPIITGSAQRDTVQVQGLITLGKVATSTELIFSHDTLVNYTLHFYGETYSSKEEWKRELIRYLGKPQMVRGSAAIWLDRNSVLYMSFNNTAKAIALDVVKSPAPITTVSSGNER